MYKDQGWLILGMIIGGVLSIIPKAFTDSDIVLELGLTLFVPSTLGVS